MALLVGIDEAGYGPVLGPLVVAAVGLELPDSLAHDDLWQRLSSAATRDGRPMPDHVCIADSKLIYHGDSALCRLERNVLATCPLPLPIQFDEFTRWLGIPEEHLANGEPWHAEGFPDLPLAAEAPETARLCQGFSTALQAAGVRRLAVLVNLAQPWRFNRLVAATNNKANVLWALATELLEKAVVRFRDDAAGDSRYELKRLTGQAGTVFVTMDKHGGRTYYGRLLRQAWPLSSVEAPVETGKESTYRIHAGSLSMELDICEKAEGRSLPVALASMYAKYVREIFMAQFNRWWSARAAEAALDASEAGVAPTAGYYTDYQRWSAEMAPLAARLGLPPEQYIRCR